jgi:hypothetical protein
MKNFTLLAAGLCVVLGGVSCKSKPKDEYAGIDGDFVSGVPLPERTDGAAYLGGNVSKGQFSPVQFGFESRAPLFVQIKPHHGGLLFFGRI